MPNAVARLRDERLARSTKPFRARGSRVTRCAECRVPAASCVCAQRPAVTTRAGMCLVMHDIEPLKPSNTGWLVADVVAETSAFPWSRTEPDPRLLALLGDPRWTPYLVFPAEGVAPERVVQDVEPRAGRRPLFVLLDGTWPESSKMFRKSPYLDRLPVLAFDPAQLTRYRLRRTRHDARLCTAEAAALCLRAGGESPAADALDGWLDVFLACAVDVRRHGAAAPSPRAGGP